MGIMVDLVVMYPDYKGEGTRTGFLDEIREVVSADTTIIPVLNGITKKDLTDIACEFGDERVVGLRIEMPSLGGALIKGYEFCTQRFPDKVVVRLDTAEHDVSYIPRLAQIASEIEGLVVGDLSFTSKTLIEGSPDELMHLDIFPTLYRAFAGVPLSCAHGYQAVSPTVLPEVLEGAKKIVSEATRGADGAMVLSAAYQMIPIEISRVPAMLMRNRTRDKNVGQFRRALHMCAAAQRVRY